MATNPLDYFTAVYGDPAWTTINLSWDGTATDYTLFVAGRTTSLINGNYKAFQFVGVPDTRYDFTVQTVTSTGVQAFSLAAYTTPLPPPSGRTVSGITNTSAVLSWQAVRDATSYEIADVSDDYTVIATATTDTATIYGLAQRTRYSFAVRTVLGAVRSAWSSPVTFTTTATGVIAAGTYTFAPVTTSVWKAGRTGSSTAAWRPTADDYYHGDGWVWGDASGEQTTYFFYGSPNPFTSIVGAGFTKLEVYVERATTGGDPGAVLSHWSLHPYASKPSGQPTTNDSEYDIGTLTRGQSGWVELPLSWAAALVTNGTHKGLAWGDIPGRYQVAKKPSTLAPPLLGTLRFTVA